MTELAEKQYELGDIVFGLGALVHVKSDGFNPGSAGINDADEKRAAGDGVRFGKDRKGSATWGFELFTNADPDDGDAEAQAWDAIGALAAAWDAEEVRSQAGEVSVLRFRIGGQTRRVYGRPRRFTATPNNLSLSGRIDAVADFATVDHRVYDDSEQTHTIQIAPPLDPDAGFTSPFISPIDTRPPSGPSQGEVVIGGTLPTPIAVTFDGPVASAKLQITIDTTLPKAVRDRYSGGWTAALVDPVAFDDPVTLDGKPWVVAATKQSGGGVRVSPRVTRISKMWLPPGRHEAVFTGVDPTAVATATLRWHNAHPLPR